MENEEKKQPQIDLKKLFDPNEYSTRIVGAEGENEEDDAPLKGKNARIATLIALLTDPENRDVKEEALVTIKKEKAGSLLIDAIRQNRAKAKRQLLIAACWESEIDFSNDLPFFVELACDDDYMVSLEAITTIENMEGPFVKEDLEAGIKRVREEKSKLNSERVVLLNDLAVTLEDHLGRSN